ncbi:hypothetical protein QE152_g36292 [Popillia japonica]|uniref:Uncharacterized protein n=1 Tax=Popillia japonica TaxID=7064 RepID=A0AAW1IDL4_POPJA
MRIQEWISHSSSGKHVVAVVANILRKRLEPHGIATYTSKPAQNPESLSMINEEDPESLSMINEEEHHHTPFAPTPPATTAHDDPKARAINFTHMDEDPNAP